MTPIDILTAAIEQYNPSHVFALFSGGYDSLVTAHITAQHSRFSGCIHIDTGTGIPATRAYVEATCERYGWPLNVYATPRSVYEDWVRGGGFPGPAQHSYLYRILKERQIEAALRDHKQHRHDRIMFVAGARQHESERRMGKAQEVRRIKTQVWVNPIFYWSKTNVLDYRDAHNLPRNPVVDLLHRSGECNCGCYAQPEERDLLRVFYPQFWEWLSDLEAHAHALGYYWNWGEAPPAWFQQLKQGQDALFDFMPLCTSCEARA